MNSPCLCTPGSLQLSLDLLAKPQSQKMSAGAGGALPPWVLLHSQLVGTEEDEEGSPMGSNRAVGTCLSRKSKTAKTGSE